MKTHQELVLIYGFKRADIFLYVGQTVDFKIREKNHRRFKTALKKSKFVKLRAVNSSSAHRIEGQIIAALLRRGECVLNKVTPVRNEAISRHGNQIEYDGLIFESWAALSRHTNTCVQTLKKMGIVPDRNGSGRTLAQDLEYKNPTTQKRSVPNRQDRG